MNRLDAMLGGDGYFRGSTILVSGTAGTGKALSAPNSPLPLRARRKMSVHRLEEAPTRLSQYEIDRDRSYRPDR